MDADVQNSSESGPDKKAKKIKKDVATKTVKLKPKASEDGAKEKKDPKEPECLVCGDEASGMHYRAMTCEGCKTFFRRNAARRALLKCDLDEGKCVMNAYLRRHCAFCRMKKCLAVGMEVTRVWDKERVKTRKRIVKKPNIKVEEETPESTASASAATTMPNPPYVKVEIPDDLEEIIKKVELAFEKSHAVPPQDNKQPKLPTILKEFVVSSSEVGASKPSTHESGETITIKKEQGDTDNCHGHFEKNSNTPDSNVTCKEESKTQWGSDSISQYRDHDSIDPTMTHFEPDIPNQNDSDRFAELPMTPESIKLSTHSDDGSSPSSSGIQNKSFSAHWASTSPSSSTGGESSHHLDSNESMLQNSKAAQRGMEMMKAFLPGSSVNDMLTSYIMKMSLVALRGMIAFCKDLPVFSELSWESQAALIKGSFVEFIFLGSIHRFNQELKRVESFYLPGTGYTRETCQKAGMGNVFDKISGMADKIHPLQARDREFALMYAICVLAPDRPGLDDDCKEVVGEIQEKLAHALRLCFDSKGPGCNLNFPKAMMVLTDLRNATETYRNDVMQVELHSNVITPLLAELFDM